MSNNLKFFESFETNEMVLLVKNISATKYVLSQQKLSWMRRTGMSTNAEHVNMLNLYLNQYMNFMFLNALGTPSVMFATILKL